MNWDEMSARERDALVAEKIFGTPLDPYRPGWVIDGNIRTYLKNYTTDISAAWEVVEKMRERGHDFDAGAWNKMKPVWSARFPKEDVNNSHYDSLGDTAPEAICKAALRTVGVEV